MGHFFQNVGQMAGFFLNEAGIDKPQKENKQTAGTLPFESVLQSLRGAKPENITDLPNNNSSTAVDFIESKESEIELKEKIDLSSEVLKLCISKSKNTVTLEIPPEISSQITDGLLAPQVNRKAGWSFNGNLAEIKQSLARPLDNNSAIYKISFKPADLLATEATMNNRMAQATISNPISAGIPHQVEISTLIQLVSEYPEPIRLDVEILPEIEGEIDKALPVLPKNSGVKSSFKFDLRNLFENGSAKDSGLTEGIRTITGKNISKIEPANTGLKSIKSVQAAEFNNQIFNIDKGQSITGHSNFNKIIQNNGNAAEPKLDFGAIFQMNKKTADYFLNSNNKNSLKENNNARRNNNDKVITMTLSEKQKAGAGESKTNAKDNSSALSKISAGSEPVSENMPLSKDGVKISSELTAANPNNTITAESKLPETAISMARAIENIEEIKSNILKTSKMGRTTVKMRLHPENLGDMRIKLTWNAGKLLVDFNVETRKAGEVVSALLPELKASLEERNLKINNINLLVDENKEPMAFGQDRQFFSGSTDDYDNKQFQFSEKESPPDEINMPDEDIGSIEKDRPQSVQNGWVDLKA